MSNAIEFDRVSVVFGPRPERALPLLDAGQSREQVQAATGQTLGVHDCSLSVAEGECVVLMGLSGSGKSTLLRAVNGLNPVQRGALRISDGAGGMVTVNQTRPAALRALRRQRVAMVFQGFGLLPWRTVAQNAGLGLELAGIPAPERARRVTEQLDLVGLGGWGARRLNELSGGMQQRVGLARAFATGAPILLMDEPFSALDPLIRSRLQGELLDLQTQLKRTMLFVSHDLDEAFRMGNRIALLEGGRLVQVGTARDIIARPATPHVAEFIAHMDPLTALVAEDVMEPGSGPAATVPPEMPLRAVLGQLAEAETITVARNGKILGVIHRARVLQRLAA